MDVVVVWQSIICVFHIYFSVCGGRPTYGPCLIITHTNKTGELLECLTHPGTCYLD